MGSLIVAVRSLVIEGIQTMPAFNNPDPETAQVPEALFGYKAGWSRRERVWTGNARFNHSSASLRATKTYRDEVGSFDLVIYVEGIGRSIEQTSTRAAVIGADVEDWCATHANWNPPVLTGLIWLAIEGDGTPAEAFNDKGSIAELTYPITYRARLT